MAELRRLARFDNRFETKGFWFSGTGFARVGFSGSVLSDVLAQKVEAKMALMLIESVGKADFTSFQFHAHFCLTSPSWPTGPAE